jgi:hypothetical protein
MCIAIGIGIAIAIGLAIDILSKSTAVRRIAQVSFDFGWKSLHYGRPSEDL